jgi:DnaJ-class molecular chaperone
LRIKNAYQTLVDSNSRAKYDASQRSRTAADWDPFQWSPSRPKGNSTVQEEDFYGFGEFWRDLKGSFGRVATFNYTANTLLWGQGLCGAWGIM